MRTAPNYDEFLGYGFKASKEDFDLQIMAARGFVDRIVGPIPVTADKEEAYKVAICATVSKLCDFGADASPGFAIGGFRMEGGSKGYTGFDAARRPVLDILVPAGLAFMGV